MVALFDFFLLSITAAGNPVFNFPGPEGVARGSATDKNMINYMLSLFGTLAFSSHR